MTPRLFDRRWRLEVSRSSGGSTQTTLDVSELDLAFEVTSDLGRRPNKAKVSVWNLSEANRGSLAHALASGRRSRAEIDAAAKSIAHAKLRDPKNIMSAQVLEAEARVELARAQLTAPVTMRLSAGFAEPGISLLFSGDVTKLSVQRGTMDVITVLEGKDARDVLRAARISRSFAPGTTIEAVVRAAASSLGIGEGNLSSFVTGLTIDGDRVFREGYAATGTAANVLTDLLRPAGLRWSVQSGALQVRRAGHGTEDRAIKLSAASGLIGTPQPEEKGKIALVALIQPGLVPGARIVVESADLRGGYMITETTFRGDTRGNEWHAILKARPV